MSHPTWVRGLKPCDAYANDIQQRVAPYVGAWIETAVMRIMVRMRGSHPTWVRGLKPARNRGFDTQGCRTLRGCVD